MSYSKANLRNNGDEAYPPFRPFLTGNVPIACLSETYYRVYLKPHA
jgi:hypothetical protein